MLVFQVTMKSKCTLLLLFSGLFFQSIWAIPLSFTGKYRRGLEDHETQSIPEKLEIFILEIKKFITKDGVEIRSFSLQSNVFTTQLAEIEAQTQLVYPLETKIMVSLKVAQDQLQDMIDCDAYWKYYENSADSCDLILYKISELMLMFSLLCNLEGDPDMNIPDYTEILSSLNHRFNVLKEQKSKLVRVPFILRAKLEHEFTQAEAMIGKLGSGGIERRGHQTI